MDCQALALIQYRTLVEQWDEIWKRLNNPLLVDEALRPEVVRYRLALREHLRTVIERVDVRPTPKRAEYDVDIHCRLAALLGIDLNPPRRTPQEIVEEHGSDCSFSRDFEVSK